MNATTPTPAPTGGAVTVWARYGLIAVAWLFAAGAVVQVFLAGLGVFDVLDAPTHWDDHVNFGRTIGFLAYLLPILALVGRVGRSLFGQALAMAVLFVVQSVLANVDESYIAALHPLNGFLLLGGSFDLGRRTLAFVRGQA